MGTIVFIILGGLIGYGIGVCMFTNKEYEKVMESFDKFIKMRKGQTKSEKAGNETESENSNINGN